ncbi:hypothetical protein PMAG_a1439 [Pseudoalteromonas mariniglutinosa NCIMB 1770]|nr:hypothetical protein [Pseudoalteromonas mariniglutinosa NCIMB 1770]
MYELHQNRIFIIVCEDVVKSSSSLVVTKLELFLFSAHL